MEFGLSDDQQLFHETTRKFLEYTCPLETVRALAEEEPDGFDRSWWRRGAELGWVSMLVAEDHGGGSVSGQGLSDLALVAEEFGRRVAPGPLIPTNVVAAALSRAEATAPHKQLAGLVGGETVATWCPGASGSGGADGVGSVRASVRGDGFVLDGSTAPVEAGAQADLVLVTAGTDDGPVQFVIPSGTPGLTSRPAESIDLVRRFARLRFDHVEVDADAVLGEPGAAGDDVERQLLDAVVLQCFEMAGAVDRVFAFTVEYAEDRYSFGRPLVSYQALKHRFADMKMWLESCHATATAAARAVDSGSPLASELVSVA
ncbi:MAG TPA: acyl-CoA dehydrogenase family protein, partial [Acidimicrobiales bacterium]|nr:acyl-CoA dehydrogenase family protein [Acidimicrobiales bacterium]